MLLRKIRARRCTGSITQLKAWLAPMKSLDTVEFVACFKTVSGEQMPLWIHKGCDALVDLRRSRYGC